MKNVLAFIFAHIILVSICSGQCQDGFIISAGTNLSKYLGKGEGDNYFEYSKPGFQLELSAVFIDGFEWIIYGFAYSDAYNYVEKNRVHVDFWTPYYTEISWIQCKMKNPVFIFAGYDYTRMRFPNMEKPDHHHHITFGGGWNIKLSNAFYLQFKIKPFFVIGNSIGQTFGINYLLNIRWVR